MNDDDDIVPTQSPIILQPSPTSQSPTPNDNDIPAGEDEGDGEEDDDDEYDGRMTFSVSHILLYEKRGSVYHILCVSFVYTLLTSLPRCLISYMTYTNQTAISNSNISTIIYNNSRSNYIQIR